MTFGDRFRRSVTVMTDRATTSEVMQARVAMFARAGLQQLITTQKASPGYTRFVDGVREASEETVKLNDGNITYLFQHIAEAVAFALSYAIARSPSKSGAYKEGWFIAVNGRPWVGAFREIPHAAQIILTNREPYHRKIDTGGQKVNVPPGIIEDTRQAMQRKFPYLQVDRSFVNLPSGGTDRYGEPIPYVLKGSGVESGLTFDKKEGWGRRHAARPARAKDRRRGEIMTYPAVVFSERVR